MSFGVTVVVVLLCVVAVSSFFVIMERKGIIGGSLTPA